jgi:GntR family transcriptional repressor for pyruvate dehydrogenase complex
MNSAVSISSNVIRLTDKVIKVAKGSIFQGVERNRLSADVSKQIAQAIGEGRYLPGEMLPSERELTGMMGISRPVLREALRVLEFQGLISIQHGRGAFVKKNSSVELEDVSLVNLLEENYESLERFYEARMAIEPACAELAAKRALPEDIENLRQILLRAEEVASEGNIASYIGIDIDFHSAIARVARNEYLQQMMDSLIVPEADFRRIVLRLPKQLARAQHGHDAIFEAIEDQNPEAARQAMQQALIGPLIIIREYLKREKVDQ